MSHLGEGRVTALFSATMPKWVHDLTQKYMREPQHIQLSQPQQLTVPDIEQLCYLVPFPRKFDALARILDARQPERSIVFCATKRMVDEVQEKLQARGYSSEALHGDISQASREKVLRSFRDGRTEVLVATDVAARGLDIPDVAIVVNFDIPPDPEYYVHRIGRTGRFGRSGVAVTFINPREQRELAYIEKVTGARIQRAELPTAAEVDDRETELYQERLLAILESGDWRPFREVVESLMTDYDPVEIASAAAAIGMARSARSKSYKRIDEKDDLGLSWTRPETRRSFGDRRDGGQQRPYRPTFGSRPPQGGQRGEHRPYHRSETSREGRPDRPSFAGKKTPYGGGSARSGKPRPKDRKARKW
jgi:ATP-dependent RNA helicase DeaD